MTRIVCNSWPKAGTHAILELAQLVLGPGGWYEDRDIKYPGGDEVLIRKLEERTALHGDNFAVKGHFARSPRLEAYLAAGGWKHLFIVRDPREVLCSTWRWLKDLRRDWEASRTLSALSTDEQLRRVMLGLPRAYPFSEDAGVAWDRPLVERYAGLTAWLDAPACCILRYEELTGRMGRRRQLETITRVLAFLGLPAGAEVARIADAICNPHSLTFHTGPGSDWETVLTEEHRRLFIELGGEELVERLGYLPTRHPGRIRTPGMARATRAFLIHAAAAHPVDATGWPASIGELRTVLSSGPVTVANPPDHPLHAAVSTNGFPCAPLDKAAESAPEVLLAALDGGWEHAPTTRDFARAITDTGCAQTAIILEFPSETAAPAASDAAATMAEALRREDFLVAGTLIPAPTIQAASTRLTLVAERASIVLGRSLMRPDPRPPLVVFGTGRGAFLAIHVLEREWNIVACCDNDRQRIGRYFLGCPVVSPETAASTATVHFLPASIHAAAMEGQLLKLGVAAPRILRLQTLLDRLVVFGTGRGAEEAWTCITDPAQVLAFADNDPTRRTSLFHGRPVVAPPDLATLNPRCVVLASIHARAMQTQLLELGFAPKSIVDLQVPLPADDWLRPLSAP